jgi:tRNA 2-thiocytidine biosynthesis protein TtcA
MDKSLFNFTDLKATGEASADGDIAFDEEPCATPATNIVRFNELDD